MVGWVSPIGGVFGGESDGGLWVLVLCWTFLAWGPACVGLEGSGV